MTRPVMTTDTSLCKVHTASDGAVVVSMPETWKEVSKQEGQDYHGNPMTVTIYEVTKWKTKKLLTEDI